jgi:hypothetical protein
VRARLLGPADGIVALHITVGELETEAFAQMQKMRSMDGKRFFTRIDVDLSEPLPERVQSVCLAELRQAIQENLREGNLLVSSATQRTHGGALTRCMRVPIHSRRPE